MSGLYSLTIELPNAPELQVAGSRGHWAARHRAAAGWKRLVQYAARAEGLPEKPLRSATIVCTRRSSREPDRDNLAASFVPLINGLKPSHGYAGVIYDDQPGCVEVGYRWEKSRHLAVRLEVTGE